MKACMPFWTSANLFSSTADAMSDKVTFAWADFRDIDDQRGKDKRQGHHARYVSQVLPWGQTALAVRHVCNTFNLSAQKGKGAQKWV
jgi:hypothetical protein